MRRGSDNRERGPLAENESAKQCRKQKKPNVNATVKAMQEKNRLAAKRKDWEIFLATQRCSKS